MASPVIDVAKGWTLATTGATSNQTFLTNARIEEVTAVPTPVAELIQASYQGMSDTHHLKIPVDVKDTEALVFTVHNKQDNQPVIGVSVAGVGGEEMLLTAPDGETLTFMGIFTSCPVAGSGVGAQKVIQTITCEISGDMT